jgi:hypothetical protein
VRKTTRSQTQVVASVGRTAPILVLSLGYLSFVFHVLDGRLWNAGIGEWLDPYFINFLLEHWHVSVSGLTDPASPPMYFPVPGTLGYSHGLILYAPFYMAARKFLHPFQAYNVMLFLVLETGIMCLYFVFRTFLRLRVIESLLLTTFFFTSQNVINGGTATWSQRASVFLIPPMLLILLASRRMTVRVEGSGGSGQQSGPRDLGSGVSSWGLGLGVEWVVPLALAALSGLLFSLLLTQEFYTGLFTAMFASIALVAYLGIGRWSWLGTHVGSFWTGDRRIFARGALVLALVSGMWTFYVWMFHGASLEVLNVRISSHNWRRPAILALASLATYTQLRGGFRRGGRFLLGRPWLLSVSLGACAGCLVFLWIYLDPYSDHPAFPRDQLMNSFIPRDLAHWRGPLNFLRELGAYDTLRPFAFAAIVGFLTWVPWLNIDRHSRVSWLWLIAISVFVLTISASFDGFTLWTFLLLDRLPGFSAIRDPKRIVYVYELMLVLATGVFLTRLPTTSVFRIGVSALLVYLLVASQNRETFEPLRSNDMYDRWVAAPIAIDPSCRSFFIKGASGEYMSRSRHMWSLYNVDAMFVALNHALPTLNGYSAWAPEGWFLANPQESGYAEAVDSWIARHHLQAVCEFDIDRRTMTPYTNRRLDR